MGAVGLDLVVVVFASIVAAVAVGSMGVVVALGSVVVIFASIVAAVAVASMVLVPVLVSFVVGFGEVVMTSVSAPDQVMLMMASAMDFPIKKTDEILQRTLTSVHHSIPEHVGLTGQDKYL